MKNNIITFIAIFTLFISVPLTTFATSDFYYGNIEEIQKDSLLIRFRNPSQNNFYLCTTGGECTKAKEESLSPVRTSTGTYTRSNQGTYAITTTPVPVLSIVNYSLYRIEDGRADFISLLPFNRFVSDVRFSRDENRIIWRESNGMITTYDIGSRSLYTISTGSQQFPYWSVSPNGVKASAYDRTQGGYKIWNLETGASTFISNPQEGVFEFSEDGSKGAFTSLQDGFTSLMYVDLDGTSPTPIALTSRSTVADYIFVGETLFYAANSTESPYEWSLYEYDGSSRKIADNFSYGEYISVFDDTVAFIQMQGSYALPVLYDTEKDTFTALNPFGENDTYEDISRKTIRENGINAVIWSPEKRSEKLVLWLHGGPQRQTSYDYHPYFSYGVYDDILRRLVEEGVTVARVDYTGSWGYGEEFISSLNAHIGDRDVRDVLTILEEVQTSRMNDVYLIGNSYGGYLALRTLAEEPQAFSGAVSINGVTDWQSLISRIPSSPFASYFGGTPHTGNQVLYDRASIVNRIDRMRNEDILLVYGELDRSVPTWQTKEFFESLKRVGIEADLISFPTEEHIIVGEESLESLCEGIGKVVDEDISCSF